jgi:hypothetical protein
MVASCVMDVVLLLTMVAVVSTKYRSTLLPSFFNSNQNLKGIAVFPFQPIGNQAGKATETED